MCLIWKNDVFLDSFQELYNGKSTQLILVELVVIDTKFHHESSLETMVAFNNLGLWWYGCILSPIIESIFGCVPVWPQYATL